MKLTLYLTVFFALIFVLSREPESLSFPRSEAKISPKPTILPNIQLQENVIYRARRDLIQEKGFDDSKRDPFQSIAWTIREKQNVEVEKVQPFKNEPQAPPLPFKYVGQTVLDDGLEIFLSKNEILISIREGQVIEGTYKIKKIHANTIEIIYLPLDKIQSLQIPNADR